MGQVRTTPWSLPWSLTSGKISCCRLRRFDAVEFDYPYPRVCVPPVPALRIERIPEIAVRETPRSLILLREDVAGSSLATRSLSFAIGDADVLDSLDPDVRNAESEARSPTGHVDRR